MLDDPNSTLSNNTPTPQIQRQPEIQQKLLLE